VTSTVPRSSTHDSPHPSRGLPVLASCPDRALSEMWAAVVWAALAGKYPQLDEATVVAAVENTDLALQSSDSAVRDAGRQAAVLRQVETQWRFEAIDRSVLDELHRQSTGQVGGEGHWRSEEIVLARGWRPPIKPVSIPAALEGYYRLLDAAEVALGAGSSNLIVEFTSAAFARLLYIHPFPDGNGRTARLLANLCLRRAGLPYAAIPKVGNSKKWLDTLAQAMRGDETVLRTELAILIRQMAKVAAGAGCTVEE
jgi:fido (protein-threonine AMPylation protein)